MVRFVGRDELDLLLDWCQASAPSTPELAGTGAAGRVRLAVVHGAGGSGKTHLAAELCHRLAPANWYAGFLTSRPSDPDGGIVAKGSAEEQKQTEAIQCGFASPRDGSGLFAQAECKGFEIKETAAR